MAAPASTSQIWRFGVFEVDTHRVELRRSGTLIKLREQSFLILVHLLEHAGEIVTREELRRVLWPSDTFVDFDHSMNAAIMKLREALGDSSDTPLYIETIPKRGYRFVAPVSGKEEVESNDHPPLAPKSAEDVQTGVAAARTRPTIRRRWRTAVIVIATILLSGVGTSIYWEVARFSASTANHEQLSSTLFATPVMSEPGNAIFPVFSPTGKWIAFVWNGPERGHYNLYVQLLGTDKPLRLTTYNSGILGIPAWSPDGNQIAFSHCDGKNDGVYLISALGGNEHKLTAVSCSVMSAGAVGWLPDGSGLLMADACTAKDSVGLVLFSFVTGEKRCLIGPDAASRTEKGAAFKVSPDGKRIALRAGAAAKRCCDLYTLPISGGTPKQLTFDRQLDCGSSTPGDCDRFMWTPDGRSIVFVSDMATVPWLWRVSANGGPIEQDTHFPAVGDISKDGSRLLYSETTIDEPPAIWRATLTAPGGAVLENRKTISSQFADYDAQPSPDGTKAVWMSNRAGTFELWTSRSNGDSPAQLTHLQGFSSGTPRWSPDGKQIVFDYANRSSPVLERDIFIIDGEGRNLRAVVTKPELNVVPSWSRDGKSIYYHAHRAGDWQVWRHDLETGQEVQITHNGGFNSFESSDGKTLYFAKYLEAGIWSIPSRGGTESLVVAGKPQAGYWGYWAVTNSGLYFLDMDADPRPTIKFYEFATQKTSSIQVLDKQPAIGQPSLSASMDGKMIFYTQQDRQSAIKMIELPQ